MVSISSTIALTYDDVLILPGKSKLLPGDTNLTTNFTKKISLNIPLVSAAMDTVTESKTAIVMAQAGGIGVIHKNMSITEQANQVLKVKKFEAGRVIDPITIHKNAKLSEVVELTEAHGITGVPVVDKDGILEGILTNRDMRFEDDLDNVLVKDVMTPKDRLIIGMSNIKMSAAKKLLKQHRIEKLPIVDKNGRLKGLITIRDINKTISYPFANKDSLGRLVVAAAVGVGESEFSRATELVNAGVDVIVIGTAHGHSQKVFEMVKIIKSSFKSKVEVVAGNVATAAACNDLIKLGVDGIKVGIGPGSICTTRVIAGIGVPQFSAVAECSKVGKDFGVPIIADGGVKFSGDIVKALAAGASSVMIGSLFAGTDESPGELVLYKGRSYKTYRGMGSLSAMVKGSKDRYGQADVKETNKLVPEGIEGPVPHRGHLPGNIFQLLGGVKSGMGYVGAPNLESLYKKAKFIQITAASLKESHPHDVHITKEAPNYSIS